MKLIDISHTLDGNTPVLPGDYKTALSRHKAIEKDWYNAYLLQSGLHTGTHIDMPMHLVDDDKYASDFPLDCFAGNGVLLDVRGENPIEMKPAYRERISARDIVLLYTGFAASYFREEYFTEYPDLSCELAEFLLSRKIKILGMDTPSPDHPPYTLHKELLRQGVFILENLTNLQALAGIGRFKVVAVPLKIRAEASFVRAFCIADE
ncbi:MAG: cyclase family protein [Oscillospiraceae bacterium]|jgi:kynurenine formamidase|nr:cyclase family protein [Oscillospiraceae bacterium]